MKKTYLVVLALFIATSAFAIDPYDYWAAIAQVPDTTTTTTVIKRVVVFIGNNGPFSGPNYDVMVTVKTGGGQSVVCSTGLNTQAPLAKGKQMNVLVFQLAYPKGRPRLDPRKVGNTKFLIFANINTQYPNDDTNAANGTQSKEFSFPSGGTPECKPFS